MRQLDRRGAALRLYLATAVFVLAASCVASTNPHEVRAKSAGVPPQETRDALSVMFRERVERVRGVAAAEKKEPTILMIMLARNEEQNLKRSLHLWRSIIDAFVIALDDRTTDNSSSVILSSLQDIPGMVLPIKFDGFGPTWTEAIRVGQAVFPSASHILLAETDWIPDPATFNRSEITMIPTDYYTFEVTDKASGMGAKRPVDDLFFNMPEAFLRYRLHEQLFLPGPDPSAYRQVKLGFHVEERKGGVMDRMGICNRSRSEIKFLERDFLDNSTDPRTMYYFGVTSILVWEKCGKKKEDEFRMYEGRYVLHRRATDYPFYVEQDNEMTYNAAHTLGLHYQYHALDSDYALRSYLRSAEVDPERADGPLYLSWILMEAHPQRAWPYAIQAMRTKMPYRRLANVPYVYTCLIPLQVSRLIALLHHSSYRPHSVDLSVPYAGIDYGYALLRQCEKRCTDGEMGNRPTIPELRGLYSEMFMRLGRDPVNVDVDKVALPPVQITFPPDAKLLYKGPLLTLDAIRARIEKDTRMTSHDVSDTPSESVFSRIAETVRELFSSIVSAILQPLLTNPSDSKENVAFIALFGAIVVYVVVLKSLERSYNDGKKPKQA